MNQSPQNSQHSTAAGNSRFRRDDGTAIVEFALVGVFLVFLLIGVISFGLLLSFKQNLTQAAAEGARSVVGFEDNLATVEDERYARIGSTLATVTSEYTNGCGENGVEADGITCKWIIHQCDEDTSNFATIPASSVKNNECVTVRIEYDNRGSNRLLPAIPLVSSVEPDSLSAQSTSRLERDFLPAP